MDRAMPKSTRRCACLSEVMNLYLILALKLVLQHCGTDLIGKDCYIWSQNRNRTVPVPYQEHP